MPLHVKSVLRDGLSVDDVNDVINKVNKEETT